ncbi:hypothetical protein MBLNU230_g4090t1 [Neophaeotheca triangularis]
MDASKLSSTLPTLPVELWDSIFSYLWYPDLASIALTNKICHGLVKDTLDHQFAVWSKYHHIRHDVGKLFHSSDSRTGRLWPILLAVLRDPAAAHYVEHLDFYSQILSTPDPPHPWQNPAFSDNQPETFAPTPEETAIVDHALRGENLWSLTDNLGRTLRLHEAILTHGSEGAMAALLLLKCPNLRSLSLQTLRQGTLHNKWILKILGTLSTFAAFKPTSGPPLPLCRLVNFTCNPYKPDHRQTPRGIYWSQLTTFMSLPSLRTLILPCVQDWRFDCGSSGTSSFAWPPHLPKSNVRDVDIRDGTLEKSTILQFARAIRGPCVIRQAWGPVGESKDAECMSLAEGAWGDRWDLLEIPYADAPESEWRLELTHPWDGPGDPVRALKRHGIREADERRWRWQCCLDGEGCQGCVHCVDACCREEDHTAMSGCAVGWI